MKKYLLIIIVVLMAHSTSLFSSEVIAKGSESRQNLCYSPASVKLKEDLRRLWIDHTIWTRDYIKSAVDNLEDKDKVLARLLQNQKDLGNSIKPYYGEEAGNKLAELLTDHIVIAGKIVDAVKSGNETNTKKYNAEWYKNADDIAEFLSKANPNWSVKELRDMLYMHLKLVADTLEARMNRNWDADIIAFDKGEDHIIKMADALTEGIIKQFPDKF